ncbi:hypothetical protein SK128_023623 [Halocaridina rubra]|uniref:Uncharacterized protein n=1 Tax=Halocaridina rubra TaxID=373956 RepID=A0AAN8XI13_HALRR
MWCRTCFLLLLVGCILSQTLAFNYGHKERGKIAEWSKNQVEENAKLLRQHREALVEETTPEFWRNVNLRSNDMAKENELEESKENGKRDNGRNFKPSGPAHQPHELPIAIKPYRVEHQKDNSVETDQLEREDGYRQYRPNGPEHKPHELPIAIKPYRVDTNMDEDGKTDEEPMREVDISETDDGSSQLKTEHRTPILNIKHEFM